MLKWATQCAVCIKSHSMSPVGIQLTYELKLCIAILYKVVK